MTVIRKRSFVALLILATTLVSCEKEETEFQKINLKTDWQLYDEFSHKEKMLFDTLDFSRTALYQPEETDDDYLGASPPGVAFYPNPFQYCGGLYYNYKTTPIINVVIVNSSYKKIFEGRFENAYNGMEFDFSDRPSGIYKLYYVIQDSNYNIVHKGHGFIEKEKLH